MNLVQKFVSFLLNQKPKPSLLTVKNYKADIGQFISWFENEFKSALDPSKITIQIIERYKKIRNLSESSMERHTSSLRKFFNFLNSEGILSENPLKIKTVSAEAQALKDPWMIRNFKSFLYEHKKSTLTIKNYINDVKSFFVWLEEVALVKYSWNVADRNLLDKINSATIKEYKQRLITAKFSPLTINRKLSSLRSYIGWAKSQGLIPKSSSAGSENSASQNVRDSDNQIVRNSGSPSIPSVPSYSSFPPKRIMQKSIKGINFLFDYLFILPLAQILQIAQHLLWTATGQKIFKKNVIPKSIQNPLVNDGQISNIKKEFYTPLDTSVRYLPAHKRIWHYIRYARPNWYKKYHSYSFTHYFHFAILIILSCTVGFGIYDSLFNIQKDAAVLGASASPPPRILSFQGKLTDSSETPIVEETSVLFSLYNDENASSAAALWREENTVEPDSSGVFSVFLGKITPIPDDLFSQNPELFLGITVGNSPELQPRQELATVPFASNSRTLQGLEPITNSTNVSNVVLALDSSGNLSIAGAKAHTFQVIGGNFVLSGKVLSLTTVPGSNGNIEIVPNGIGTIDLSKPIQNSTNNNNLTSAAGSVEFDDTVAILATTSAQAALYINQNSTGALISASTSGTAKFVVENNGTGKFSGDIEINGGDLLSTVTTFNLLNSTVTTLNMGGAATTLNIGVSGGTTTVKSNLTADKDFTLSSLSSNGGILYTNGSGKFFQVSAGSSSDCLLGGTTPTFGSCTTGLTTIDAFWNTQSGALFTNNSTVDLLIGGTSTASAKFAVLNVNSGTPTASISGNLSLAVPTTAGANTFNLLNNSTLNFQRSPGGDAGLTSVLYLGSNGNVGIGTTTPGAKFDIVGGQTQIEISTQYSERLCHTGADGSSTQSVLLGDCLIGGSDIAEYYGSKDLTIEPGDVVIAAPGAVNVGPNSKAYVNKSDSSYQGGIVGIVSTNPYDVFGNNFNKDEYSFPVALVGRIPVKVSLENGSIKAGDLLTSSSIPGVAMKATKTGPIVGKALEDLDAIDESKVVGFYDPENKEYRNKSNFPNIPKKPSIISIVKIYTFANVSWYDPGAYLAQNGELKIVSSTENKVSENSSIPNVYYLMHNASKEFIERAEAFTELMAANFRAGLVKASEVITNTLVITSDSIIVNGLSLKDYIVNAVEDSGIIKSVIISPVVSVNQLSTNIISPLSSPSLIVKLSTPSGSLIVENAGGSAAAKIDDQGNARFAGDVEARQASFSGIINSLSLKTNDASISGTLRAGNIIADSITGLETKISNMYSADFADLASHSAQFSYVPDLAAERAQFNQGLMVFGSTSLSDLSVAGRLSVGGTMFVTENSLETLGTDLSFQSLRQGGLSIMGGLVYIDTQGNIKIQGNLSVSGKLAVNVISPLSTSDLAVNNAEGINILSINQAGDMVASGSGTFAKLNFNPIQPVLAVSATEIIASSSAGVANIAPYQSEVTINNDLVTNKSVIYITPVGTPSAQTPFLMRQIPNKSFTVGVQSPTNHPLDFNWLIIN